MKLCRGTPQASQNGSRTSDQLQGLNLHNTTPSKTAGYRPGGSDTGRIAASQNRDNVSNTRPARGTSSGICTCVEQIGADIMLKLNALTALSRICSTPWQQHLPSPLRQRQHANELLPHICRRQSPQDLPLLDQAACGRQQKHPICPHRAVPACSNHHQLLAAQLRQLQAQVVIQPGVVMPQARSPLPLAWPPPALEPCGGHLRPPT